MLPDVSVRFSNDLTFEQQLFEVRLKALSAVFPLGNTAQSLCARCAVRFFVRLYRNFAGGLTPGKKFLCNMTENLQADCV
ncbi:MAG: hypothetical protein PUK49_02495, partial [Oscillospiraceae bacterium]|nr:hypothetical protein [Oscillospiraceae bacterium]